MSATSSERRREPRLSVNRPVKLQCAMTGRYMQGHVRNVSATGVLVEINHPSMLVQGQQMRLGIAWNDQTVLLQQKYMAPAVVVRSLGLGGRQHVAMAFEQRQQVNLAASA